MKKKNSMQQHDELLQKGIAHSDEAEKYYAKGIYSTALQHVDHAEQMFLVVNNHRWLTFVRHKKMQILKDTNEYNEALDTFESVMKGYLSLGDQSGLTLALIHRGSIFAKQEKYLEALGVLRIAETLVKTHNLKDLKTMLFSDLSLICYQIGDMHATITYAGKLLNLHTTDDENWVWAHCTLGDAHHKAFAPEIAEKHYIQAFESCTRRQNYPMAAQIMERLCTIYALQGYHKKAEDLRAKMIRISKMGLPHQQQHNTTTSMRRRRIR